MCVSVRKRNCISLMSTMVVAAKDIVRVVSAHSIHKLNIYTICALNMCFKYECAYCVHSNACNESADIYNSNKVDEKLDLHCFVEVCRR